MSTALTVRVGNELGAGNPRSARRTSYIGLGIGGEELLNFDIADMEFKLASCMQLSNSLPSCIVLFGVIISALLLVLRYQVGKVLTSRP